MPFRPDDYDGSYCISCRQPFLEGSSPFECQSCGYFDDGLFDDDEAWITECREEREANFQKLKQAFESGYL